MSRKRLTTGGLRAAAMLLAAGAGANAASIDEFNDNNQQWGGNDVSGLTESGGVLSGTKGDADADANDADPYLIRGDFVNFQGDQNGFLSVRFAAPSTYANQAQIFWWGEGQGAAEARSHVFQVTNDGTLRTYTFDLSADPDWQQEIRSLRFDITGGATGNGDPFQVDYFRVSPSAADDRLLSLDTFSDSRTGGWTYSGMSGVTESGGQLHGTASTGDPIMTKNVPEFSGSLYPTVKVTMRVNTPTDGQALRLFWDSTAGGLSEARAIGADLIEDGQFHDYFLDVGSNPGWAGQTINLLRFDPTTLSGASFDIDSIELIPVPEPGALGLLGLAAAGLLARRRA